MNYIALIRPIVAQASAIILSHFHKVHDLNFKYSSGGAQTNVDILVEKFLKKELVAALPGSGFIAEETQEKNIQKYTWIIDPIDGTANFIRKVPYFCINVALMYEQEIIAGMTVQPLSNDMFYAQKGEGFWWNEHKINLEEIDYQDRRVVFVVSDWLLRQPELLNAIRQLCKNDQQEVKFRVNGAVALDLALSAAGSFDACIFQDLAVWDMAPALLYFKEAGGLIIDEKGTVATMNSKRLIAGRAWVVEQVSEALGSDLVKNLKKDRK